MKSTILILAILICSFSLIDRNCIKGNIRYSIATYSDEYFLKPHYQKFFDSLFQKSVYNYICNQEIKNLPTGGKNNGNSKSPSRSHIIEPLFVDLETFNGVYGKRIYSLEPKARNPRFKCGFYHYLFIFSNNEYIELTRDSLNNEKLIKENLKHSFTDAEILRMTNYYKYWIICDDFTFLPPMYIKRGDSIIFDANKE